MSEKVSLAPVDGLDVTIVMDNSIDLLTPSTETATRMPFPDNFLEADQLRAEHGYSLSLAVHRNGHTENILYDAGLSRDSTMHNLDVLGIDPKDYRAVVLSHGHADHHGGLEGLFGRVGASMPLVVHPHAWRERKIVFPTGAETRLAPPSFNDLDREGWQVVEEVGPSVLLDGSVLVTGQIDRVTDFEKGFPIQEAQTDDGAWEPDHWTWDDQAIVVHVRGKGLVVLSSCSHSGAINVLHHARRVTGIDQIHGFVGGLHLSGGLFEPITPDTVQGVIDLQPDVVVPGHCTGWKAIQALGNQLPDAYVPSNVGTTFVFHATEPAA